VVTLFIEETTLSC